MGSPWDQTPYAVRAEHGLRGALEVAGGVSTAVVVDTLSFTTCVSVALERGIAVRPFRWRDERAGAEAAARGALLAVPRQNAAPDQVSLSPVSLARVVGVDKVVLPSPNGSTICAELAATGVAVVAGCMRNVGAVARWVAGRGGPVAFVAAGERWSDTDELRPAFEDIVTVGALVDALLSLDLTRSVSPEAELARAAYLGVRDRIPEVLRDCASGRELVERGYAADVAMAAALDASEQVPILTDGWFVEAA